MDDEADADLLRRFSQGDLEAFERLFRQFQADVFRWTLRIVRDPAAAEDAVVEAFWRTYRGRAHFDPTRSFGAWMRRIAVNVALSHLDAVSRVPRATVPVTELVAREDRGPEIADAVTRALQRLPPKLRIVATLALVDELPQADIAEVLGVPVGTVKSRVFRATRALRAELTRLGIHP